VTIATHSRKRHRTATPPPRENFAAEDISSASLSPSEGTFAKVDAWRFAPTGLILAAAFGWAYWQTLVNLVAAWNREPDYSHGFFVAPLAVYFLWAKRDRFPGVAEGLSWLGLTLIALAGGARVFSAHYYLEAIDGWSIMLWLAGVTWLFCGWRATWWSLPSIAFLWFMVPLPFRIERGLSLPLQTVATKLSCWILQALGQPALAEAHVIVLGDNRLEVEQACSGLRIFVGIVALAFAYTIVVERSWWEKAILLASSIPIALLANASRIVATGLLYQYVSGEAAKKFSHDAAGWVMILLAAGLFACVLWYVHNLVREVELVEVGAFVRRDRA
jgi:exosortase